MDEDQVGSRPGRRQLLRAGSLLTLGVGLGAGGEEVGRLAAGGPSAGAATPNEAMMTEHGVLKRVLLAYDAAVVQPPSAGLWSAVHTCALVVRDYVESFHEGLEETFVFPQLLNAGRQTAVVTTLLGQHGAGRRITTSLVQATDPAGTGPTDVASVRVAIAAFTRMYARHEAWEDTVVYPAHRDLLGDRAIASLGERFDELERRQLGPHALADVLDRLAPAEQQLGTYDLAAVTPAPTDLAR